MLHACLKGCTIVQGYSTGFFRVFQGSFKSHKKSFKYVSRKFLECVVSISRGDSREFSGCFRSVFRVVERGSKRVSMQFQGSFPRVSRKFLGVSW